MKEFTQDQQKAFEILKEGKSVFLTGEAGTGKSFVLNAFLDYCDLTKKNVLVMAPTGIAALNLKNGSTIHRSLQIKPEFLDPNRKITAAKKVLVKADVIVIDEISMVRIDLFDRIAKLIKNAEKKSSKKQIVFIGDFFQLPPVVTENDVEAMLNLYPDNLNGYSFKSKYWKEFNLTPCILKEVVRQSENEYVKALTQARYGHDECLDFFNDHSIENRSEGKKESIWLCSTNRNASAINKKRLAEIETTEKVFTGEKTGIVNQGDMPTDEVLHLKVGARVMSVVNSPDKKYQNGSLGYIEEIGDDWVLVHFDNGNTAEIIPYLWEVKVAKVKNDTIVNEVIGTFEQIPLRLAWAITIHKSQGQTFDSVNCETNVFQAGMLYVALSRCSNSENLCIYPEIKSSSLYAQEEVTEFYKELEKEIKDDSEENSLQEELSPEAKQWIETKCSCGEKIRIETVKPIRFCPFCGKEL